MSITLPLICAFGLIILPDKRAKTLLCYFFLQIVHIAGILRKANNITKIKQTPHNTPHLTEFSLFAGTSSLRHFK